MANFRASIEDYLIPRAKEWHVNFTLLGEQGAELIHARFYHSMHARYMLDPAVILNYEVTFNKAM